MGGSIVSCEIELGSKQVKSQDEERLSSFLNSMCIYIYTHSGRI